MNMKSTVIAKISDYYINRNIFKGILHELLASTSQEKPVSLSNKNKKTLQKYRFLVLILPNSIKNK